MARSKPRQTPFPYSPFCAVPADLPSLRQCSLSRAVNRKWLLLTAPGRGQLFFGKKGKRKEQLKQRLWRHDPRREVVYPPSVCLRDSARGPCTFGTQFNEILQRSLRFQFRSDPKNIIGPYAIDLTEGSIPHCGGNCNRNSEKSGLSIS